MRAHGIRACRALALDEAGVLMFIDEKRCQLVELLLQCCWSYQGSELGRGTYLGGKPNVGCRAY